MNTTKNSVEVLGTGNTVNFERVMNQFTSSFTESFLKVIESQIGREIYSTKFEVVKPKSKTKPTILKVKTPNGGFEKLKNTLLKTQLEKSKSVEYDESKFITIRELGIKSIYELDKRSKGFWNEYFSNWNVYLRKGVDSTKISQRILFDRGIERLLNGGKSEQKGSDFFLPK